MTSIHSQYNVLHQIFEIALGNVRGDIFYRTSGPGWELGDNAPLLHLVAQRKGYALGRPRKSQEPRKGAPVIHAYALDASGHWWSVRYIHGGKARARTLVAAPHSKLGKGYWGRVNKMKQEAAQALQLATAAHLRQLTGCDLL